MPNEDQVQWAAPGRKRKKGPDSSLFKGVKLRKSSATDEQDTAGTTGDKEKATGEAEGSPASKPAASANTASAVAPVSKAPVALALGLGYASSDDDN